MSHQPFETWLLDGAPLSSADRRSLQAHLDTCEHCRHLQHRWEAVQSLMRAAPMAAPAPGFTQRWQAGLAERRARAQRRQAWKIFGIFLAAALVTAVLLGGYMAATTSPTDWLTAFAGLFGTVISIYSVSSVVVQTWLNNAPLGLTIVLWIYLTVCLCLMAFVWVAIVWRTNIIGVLNR